MPKGTPGRAVCSVEGCTNVVHGKGLCHAHGKAKRRKEDPEFVAREKAQHNAWLIVHKDFINERHRITRPLWLKKIKDQCYEAYGGYICACCKENEPLFLTLDHKHGGGNAHRKGTIGIGGGKIYTWIKKNKFPKDMFQVLCWNCNSGRDINGGICPHTQETQNDNA